MKLNCWEVKKCSRELGGEKVSELGICTTSIDGRLNNIHDGKNGGRACWVMNSTLCGGQIQGGFKEKYKNCFQCEFYKQVVKEEDEKFIQYAILLKMLYPQD